MKKNLKEIIIWCIQLFMFYIFPLFMYLLEPITTVMLILLTTFVLSFVLGRISNSKIKYLYPVLISILFLPTVFIYYNESALVHAIWYLVVAIIGVIIGTIIKKIMEKISLKERVDNRKKILIILIFLLIGIITYLGNNNEFTIGKESNISIIENGVSLSVKENTVTKTGLTLILKNDSNGDVIYSEPYEIEVEKDKVWHKINVEIDFILHTAILESQDSNEIELDWEEGYGELSSGKYRIIKEISVSKEDGRFDSFFIAAEFTIK